MRTLPFDLGTIHLVGIGGIGMSGIAEILVNLGYQVTGSDIAENPNVARLRTLGARVAIGHAAENLGEAGVVVVSSAVQADNLEVVAARDRGLPIVRRAEMLAELMRLKWSIAVGGTHGKTTTTSMVAAMLEAGGHDPTVINGGIINAYGTNARLGAGEWMVVEADESDGTFVKLPATVCVITNIDPEHLDFYGTEQAIHDAFLRFVENIPFYGFAVVCLDHPAVQSLIARVEDRRFLTYGFSAQAEVRGGSLEAVNGSTRFDAEIRPAGSDEVRRLERLELPMVGQHNVSNALAAVAIGHELGYDEATIRRALAGFSGVKRRFTKTGEVGGITVIDDYGHHPVEITAVLGAARQSTKGRVIAVVQPHRYSRLGDLFEDFCSCFNDADAVLVAPVYAAGEEPRPGVDSAALVEGLRARRHRHAELLEHHEDLPRRIAELARPGDLVVCLGAGSITRWANALPDELRGLVEPAASREAQA